MISPTVLASTSTNFLLEALQAQLPPSDSDATLDWLVVTHDDAQLIRRLTEALGDKHHAILPLHQAAWNFTQGNLRRAIEAALEMHDLEGLLVVGHSQALIPSAVPQAAREAASRSTVKAPAGTSRILRGVTESQMDLDNAKHQFQQSLARLAEVPLVQSRVQQQRLSVVGLFYLSESGIFLGYDPETNAYEPLIHSM